jgi:serine/threonine-protein kinase
MSLAPGTRLGPYEVNAKLGEGGMGEVYRARDSKLGRDVALKILPAALSNDPERQARFRHEATVLASLNHPNIGHIYGFEDSGTTHALVLELVDGPTLADRLRGGALDQAEVLGIARQIADAIEAAHDVGVVHRDLKPANVKVRPDGAVKVLDFGLAKALDPSQGSRQGDMSNSPTLTSPARTEIGVILGTAAYMAPEQARGRAVDKRADIWAFGCVLFEMLTGRAAFAGDNITDTLAAVVRGEPDWTSLPDDVPPSIRRLLRRCLAKDRKDRLSDIGAARLEIDDVTRPVPASESASTVTRLEVQGPRWSLAASFVLGAIVTGLAVWVLKPAAASSSPSVLRFELDLPGEAEFAGNAGSGVAIAPDGLHIAYTASPIRSPQQVFVRNLVTGRTVELSASGIPYGPFMSPDGRQAGFIASGILWRAPVDGGTPAEIGRISTTDRGVVWSPDGFIYSGGAEGLSRIHESGGNREPLTTLDKDAGEVGHRFPAVVPGNQAILFTIFKGGLDDARIGVLDLASRQVRVLFDRPAHSAQVVGTHLVYLRSGALMAVSFDAARIEVTGEPKPIVNGVAFNNGGAAHFAVSANGTLVYQPAERVFKSRPAWLDARGGITPIEAPIDEYGDIELAPDGRQIVLSRFDANRRSDLLVWDVERKAMARVTSTPGYHENPIWTPDGRALVFQERTQLGSFGRLMRQPADGSTPAVEIAAGPTAQLFGESGRFPGSFLRDGATLFFAEQATAAASIFAFDVASSTTKRLGVAGSDPRISPDGRWLAYVVRSRTGSVLSVVPYPATSSGRWTVSPLANRPRWSRDGRQLFYATPDGIFAVDVSTSPAFQTTAPRRWHSAARFDVASDGRLLILLDEESRVAKPVIVLNWLEELRAIP